MDVFIAQGEVPMNLKIYIYIGDRNWCMKPRYNTGTSVGQLDRKMQKLVKDSQAGRQELVQNSQAGRERLCRIARQEDRNWCRITRQEDRNWCRIARQEDRNWWRITRQEEIDQCRITRQEDRNWCRIARQEDRKMGIGKECKLSRFIIWSQFLSIQLFVCRN